jgi:hypothetical protein
MYPIDLATIAGTKYRITMDPSGINDTDRESRAWYLRVPAKYGLIASHSSTELLAYCNAPRVFARLLKVPTTKIRQAGDTELSASFAPTYLGAVAEVLKAYRRPRLSDAERSRRAEQVRSFVKNRTSGR